MGNNPHLIGNYELISGEEEILAEFLRKRNLERINDYDRQRPVKVSSGIYAHYIKRILDLLISIPAFIITFPFNCIFGICTFFDVGRPIFFKQTRVGLNGKPFVMIKFRNMNENKDKNGKLLPPSQRVTKFGKFMRKYSLDELLNFWMVIKGDMSIIGPRPLPMTFTERMSERHKLRNAVKPGLECPRVMKADPKYSLYENQFENDIWYVENISFVTDLMMLCRLFKMTFNSKYRSKTAEGASYFVGYDDNYRATSLRQFKKEYPDKKITELTY